MTKQHWIFRQKRHDWKFSKKIDAAERLNPTCDVYGCSIAHSRIVGGRSSWLRFCSKHKDVAATLTLYLHDHPNARPKKIQVEEHR